MISREYMEDRPIKTIYEVEWDSQAGKNYYTADELTLLCEFGPTRNFKIKTLTYSEYLDLAYKGTSGE